MELVTSSTCMRKAIKVNLRTLTPVKLFLGVYCSQISEYSQITGAMHGQHMYNRTQELGLQSCMLAVVDKSRCS